MATGVVLVGERTLLRAELARVLHRRGHDVEIVAPERAELVSSFNERLTTAAYLVYPSNVTRDRVVAVLGEGEHACAVPTPHVRACVAMEDAYHHLSAAIHAVRAGETYHSPRVVQGRISNSEQ